MLLHYNKNKLNLGLIIDIKYKIKNKTKGSIFPRFLSYDNDTYNTQSINSFGISNDDINRNWEL